MIRTTVLLAGFLSIWSLVWYLSGAHSFILPPPWEVAIAFHDHIDLIARHASITLTEIVLGMICGCGFAITLAITLIMWRPAAAWVWPIFIATQAMPVFAIAPLLVLWLGYGMASKVAMASLIIFFPLASSFYDGLRRTDPSLIDLAHTMSARKWSIVRHIRIPAALPSLASGLKVSAAVAPIGAIVGEWVGSSEGLGFLMLNANARVQIPLMFAALFTLTIMATSLHSLISASLRYLLPWVRQS